MYDCLNCPGYCCSYPLITLKKRDVERLAKHFDLSFDDAKSKFTEEAHGEKYAMRRKKDEHFGKICQFFDTEERRCTIYKARPKVCRQYPNTKNCGYYDFLSAERLSQEDPDYVATTQHD
ncbi:MAG: YkgJ family cysteine cluster protein [Pseudomonadota bacterium]